MHRCELAAALEENSPKLLYLIQLKPRIYVQFFLAIYEILIEIFHYEPSGGSDLPYG